jgi:hypothetical protein
MFSNCSQPLNEQHNETVLQAFVLHSDDGSGIVVFYDTGMNKLLMVWSLDI